MTIKVDQIGDAIISGPGVYVEMLNYRPASEHIKSTGAWETIDEGGADEASGSFHVPVQGLYLVRMVTSAYAYTGDTNVNWRIIIDRGTADEQIVGDTAKDWYQRYKSSNRDYNWISPTDTVHLTAGNHTIDIQWAVAAGTDVGVSSSSAIKAEAVLISGSGAGGTLVERVSATSLPQTITADFELGNYDDITGLSTTVDVSEGEQLLITLRCVAVPASATSAAGRTRILVNSTPFFVSQGSAQTTLDKNLGGSVLTSPLSAGSYTIKAQAGSAGSLPTNFRIKDWADMEVARFRGGLVPIRQDGYNVVDRPAALDFIGAGVYQVTEGTGSEQGVAKIELNQAITAPGATIEMLSHVPSTGFSTSSTTFVDINAEFSSTFEVPTAGTYQLFFAADMFFSASGGGGRYQLVFDAGGAAEQTVGEDDTTWAWQQTTAGNREYRSVMATVELTAGSHTVKPQWKRYTGTGSIQISAGSGMMLWGYLVTGSGAGGALVDQQSNATDVAVGTSPSTLINTHVIDVADEEVLLTANLPIVTGGVATNMVLSYRVDGGSWIPFATAANPAGYDTGVSGSTVIMLSAGARTIDVGVHTAYSASTMKGATSTTGQTGDSEIWRFRGGLVPIRDDSVTVVDKPAAIDFVGPNVQVTNQGGTAKVAYNGVAEAVLVDTQVNTSDVGSITQTFTTINTHEVTTLDEDILIEANLPFTITASNTAWLGYRIDGGTWYRFAADGISSGWWSGVSGQRRVSIDAGDHTIEIGLRTANASGTLTMQGSSQFGGRSSIWRFRGGYVQPENVPVLNNVDGYLYEYISAPGAANELRITMNDGVRYKANSPVQMDLDSTGLGGREISAALASGTWYYSYAVPDPDNSGYFGIVASDQHPGLGPDGYSSYRYLGAVYYINATSLLRKARQVGNKFDYPDALDETTWVYDSGSGGTTEVTPTADAWYSFSTSGAGPGGGVQNDLRNAVPVSAVQADFSANMDTDSGEVYDLFIDSGEVLYTPVASAATPGAFLSCDLSGRDANRALVSLYNGDAYFRWTTQNSGPLSWLVMVRGYVDGYLTNLESQRQAVYVPDSMLPQLSWAGVSQVDVSAAPGQTSVVKLTLQDGKERIFNGTLSFDPSLGAVDGGLDTGTETADTWYYLYLVPKSGNDDLLVVRGSTNPPYSGPSGYSAYRYLGAVRNDTGDIRKFYQIERDFRYLVNLRPVNSSASADGSPVQLNLDTYVPKTSALARMLVYFQGNNAAGEFKVWVTGEQGASNNWHLNALNPKIDYTGGDVIDDIPVPGDTKEVYYQRTGNANFSIIKINGWTDGYLGQSLDAAFSAIDEKVGISSNDTTPGYLGTKLVPGTGVALSEENDGGDERLRVSLTAGAVDGYNAKVSSNDTTPDFLGTKIVPGTGIALSQENDGADERLRVSLTAGAADSYNTKVSANDTTPDYLGTKLIAGSNVTLTEQNDGSNETLRIDASGGVADLHQAYMGGRTVWIVEGQPVLVDGYGTDALELDGYLTLDEIPDPTALADKGLLYAAEVDGYAELHYKDNHGIAVQITDQGFVATDGYSGVVQVSATIALVIFNGLILNVIES